MYAGTNRFADSQIDRFEIWDTLVNTNTNLGASLYDTVSGIIFACELELEITSARLKLPEYGS